MEDNKSEARSNSSVFVEEEENEIEVPGVKKEIQKNSSRKKYHNIPNEMRLKLIEYVENKGEKIKHVMILKSLLIFVRLRKDLVLTIPLQNQSAKFTKKREELIKRPLKEDLEEKTFL